MDTPGLADVSMREQAAREIESALKKDGNYSIFFMITLEAGRVKPEDVTTINTVMDAVKVVLGVRHPRSFNFSCHSFR
jgi:hypothetical protein